MTAANLLSQDHIDQLFDNLFAILILPYKQKIRDKVEKSEVVGKEGNSFDISHNWNASDE